MIELIDQHRSEIEQLCRQFGVRRLEVFGSAARDDFDPRQSDVDFFYEFLSEDWRGAADRFFGFLESLEKLLGRKVDLVSLKAAKNPYFLKSARGTTVLLYAA